MYHSVDRFRSLPCSPGWLWTQSNILALVTHITVGILCISYHPWLLSVISQWRDEGQQKTLEYLDLGCGYLEISEGTGVSACVQPRGSGLCPSELVLCFMWDRPALLLLHERLMRKVVFIFQFLLYDHLLTSWEAVDGIHCKPIVYFCVFFFLTRLIWHILQQVHRPGFWVLSCIAVLALKNMCVLLLRLAIYL